MNDTYPDNRLSGDTVLRQAQLVMLKLLKAFDAICQKHSLRYWLDAGTLLGAVRHKGFIPWDDDLDIAMPRDDYRKFCDIAQNELPFDMFFQSPITDPGFICPWVKIRDRYSYMDEKTGPYPYSQAIFIDIFPVVFVTDRHARWRNFYILLPPFNKQPERLNKRMGLLSIGKTLLLAFRQHAFLAFMAINPLRRKFLSWLEEGERSWQYEPPIRWKNRWSEEMIFPLNRLEFEGHYFNTPANTDAYLSDYYGDYMKLPPPEKQSGDHNITAIYPTGPNLHFSALKWK